MIRLDRVELLNWDVQRHQVLPLARGVTLITGENGSGKTSILDAIKVGLGAANLGDDRRIGDYVLKQARPVAMIRILMDNRPETGTRKRPFDPLGSFSEDVVTVAVVLKATEEREYARQYFLLDGDVVPLPDPEDDGSGVRSTALYKPLPGPSEFRERLKRVGIGPHYLKLLCLPQGQVARLCKYDDGELFEKLFDIIGGRQALEEWERRVAELNEQQLEQKEVRKDLSLSERSLAHLAEKARRYGLYVGHTEKLARIKKVEPHLLREEARATREKLASRLKQLDAEIDRLARRRSARSADMERAQQETRQIEDKIEALRLRVEEVTVDWQAHIKLQAAAEARFAELDKLRGSCEGIIPEPPEAIESAMEGERTALAEENAARAAAGAERAEIEREIEHIDRGLTPFPDEVNAFRDALRTAGIPHHILAEVLEIEDRRWTASIEGFLGRYRFAVLVQDPADWGGAAELAREKGYPHGVLAPDVRGSSPRDAETLASILQIKDARYRSLLARLLRPVIPGEPDTPLCPARRGVLLAMDGFAVSRLEARVARDERFYLGRDARERRRVDLMAKRQELGRQTDERDRRMAALREHIAALGRNLADQHRRLVFEAARDEHAETRERASTLRERSDKLEETRLYLVSELEVGMRDASRTSADERVAQKQIQETEERLEKTGIDREQLVAQKTAADENLGRLLSVDLEPLGPEDQAVIDNVPSADALRSLEQQTLDVLTEFNEDEKDPGLPLNLKRQQEEVAAVAARLLRLADDLEATRPAAEEAREHYQQTTRRVFRHYFAKLKEAAGALDFDVDGRLEPRENGRFRCDIRVKVGEKTSVHYSSEELSGGQKAALSILMGMTAVSLEGDAAGFFLIDEPFAASDVVKINELGEFLERTGAQYLVSMPTSADLDLCRDWLQGTWTCSRSRGGYDKRGAPILAPALKLGFAKGARDV